MNEKVAGECEGFAVYVNKAGFLFYFLWKIRGVKVVVDELFFFCCMQCTAVMIA